MLITRYIAKYELTDGPSGAVVEVHYSQRSCRSLAAAWAAARACDTYRRLLAKDHRWTLVSVIEATTKEANGG